MKEIIKIYLKHKVSIEEYIGNFLKSIPQELMLDPTVLVKKNSYIELFYAVDENYKQITPTICKKEANNVRINSDKSQYFAKLNLDKSGIYVSNPYLHHKSGNASVSAVKYDNGIYYVYDFNLVKLLEELSLIEYNGIFSRINKVVYSFGSILLALVAIALIGYGGFVFVMLIFAANSHFLDDMFKSIIAITLGLAIYDLAKQILGHEVIFRSYAHNEEDQYNVLGKFLVSIIIALLIETLMVVFKIALKDYTQMLSAFYLLLGTTIMLVGLGFFYRYTKDDVK